MVCKRSNDETKTFRTTAKIKFQLLLSVTSSKKQLCKGQRSRPKLSGQSESGCAEFLLAWMPEYGKEVRKRAGKVSMTYSRFCRV